MKTARMGNTRSAMAITAGSSVKMRGTALRPRYSPAIRKKLSNRAICRIRSSIARATPRCFCTEAFSVSTDLHS
jgi:hypothetical protein